MTLAEKRVRHLHAALLRRRMIVRNALLFLRHVRDSSMFE